MIGLSYTQNQNRPPSPRECESSSPAEESTMDDTSISAESKPISNPRLLSRNKKLCGGEFNQFEVEGGGDETDEENGDVEVWNTLSKSFRQVQAVLDQNRSLIKQVNENHQSMIPDNLTRNVSLISEINRNISKVVFIYSDLSVIFSNIVQERRRIKKGSSVETRD